MAKLPVPTFAKLEKPAGGTVVFLAGKDEGLASLAASMDSDGRLSRAMEISEFKGKAGSAVELLAPEGKFERFLVIGAGDIAANGEHDWMRIGGKIRASAPKSDTITVVCETAGGPVAADACAAIAGGAKLRAYDFDNYRTKDKKDRKAQRLVIACADPAAARKAWKSMDAVTDGVVTARDLVNEPANMLGPVEFAARAQALSTLGLEVEVLDEKAMRKLKMGSLLGVAQGSSRPPRLVVMQWRGGKEKDQPVAFVGKGVVFDTGGISMKPAAGMEDMKGDMGGAAAVTGLMQALASRKAKVNAIGIIGLVENMPDGNAQRPGDIVTSMSGQTIEVLNTDAEGRLVLADALWYCQDRFKPKFMVNLATLTGAIMIALGNQHAGLFSNNDELANNLLEAGKFTDERLWRMPMGPDYDKMIDSKNADMKNIGGRFAGSITAAQFLQRFVNDVPWAHLDIAGTAMGSPKTDFSQSWSSGFGVRLLERLVAQNYE
ncbi:MAG: leucyl aminopeptidase [Nitratireductor sp.]|nr:leucyl aminopeptidase [Nitratireductor sp.]